ncbi:MAG: DUF4346 domain-containing protein [Promethearchaeota archaeon]
MKIWLISGEIALDSLRKIVNKNDDIKILIAPVSVAAFLTMKHLKKLVNEHPELHDGLIIIPGMAKINVNEIMDSLRVNVIKGPKNLNDLPRFLSHLKDLIKRNKDVDISEFIEIFQKEEHEKENFYQEYLNITIERKRVFKDVINLGQHSGPIKFKENASISSNFKNVHRNFFIKDDDLIIGKDFPPVIMAEIINAPELEMSEVEKQIRFFLKEGAEIIDVGCTPGRSKPARIREIISFVKEKFNCPISIDSLDEDEILAGVESGASIVLSIDQGNKDVLASLDPGVAIVIIPTNVRKGILPKDARKRAEIIADLILEAQDQGFKKIVADPILNSPIIPGIIPSIDAFIQFSQMAKQNSSLDVPLFIGGSNVTEMIDTDSTGVNSILATIGIELGAGILFTTEDSAKCLGSVHELAAARDLVYHAKIKNTYPKDLGHDALIVKKKAKPVLMFNKDDNKVDLIEASNSDSLSSYTLDPSGIYFKIMVDHEEHCIHVGVFKRKQMIMLFKGDSAEYLGKKILRTLSGLSKEHSLYLGRELARAEDSLHYFSAYIQDDNR